MPYIYKIVNNVNQKIYIGKTMYNISKRWKEHCADFSKPYKTSRPLYAAMQKYGIEHFSIEEIEQVNNPDLLEERERYWIEYYGSFKYGYNATRGGDGKVYADYSLIYNLYTKENITMSQIHNLLGYDIKTIKTALELYGITKEQRSQFGMQHQSKPVLQIDKITEEIIAVFPSCAEAQRIITNNKYDQSGSHISAVCLGKRKTAYGYRWRFLDTN